MRFLSLIVSVILVSALVCAGQEPQAPSKISTLAGDANISAFRKQLDQLASELKKHPNTTGGFVAIAGEDYAVERQRYDGVKEFIKRRPELKERLAYSRPGVVYDKEWRETEFWIVPDRDKPPYRSLIYDCSCPTTEIAGPPTFVDGRTSILKYRANVSGGMATYVSYRWKVIGGKIVSGQGSPSIIVRRNSNGRESVSVELDIELDEDCACLKHFTFLTMVVPKVPSEL